MKMTPATLTKAIDVLAEIVRGSTISVSRNPRDFLADRLLMAAQEPTILSAYNRYALIVGSPALSDKSLAAIFSAAAAADAPAVYQFIREQYRNAVALAFCKADERPALISDVCAVFDASETTITNQTRRRPFDIGMSVLLKEQLAHGDDKKAGNSQLFRRQSVFGGAELPFYSANAIIGQMRDLLADHFTQALGFDVSRSEPIWADWFFQTLYSGGIMQDGYIPKEFERRICGAASGTVRSAGMRELREILPFCYMLGFIGKHPIEGYLYANSLRPQCKEWGTGDTPVNELMTWGYLARRDDNEQRVSKATAKEAKDAGVEDAADGNKSMLANTECLRAGVVLEGGIDVSPHMTPIERAALDCGLKLLADFGYLGGKKHRDHGLVEITYGTQLDPAPYENYLSENKEKIIAYLREIMAFRKTAE